MAMNVIMPRQGQSVESCIIGDLYKKKGDQVKEGEIILTFETDKAQFDLESPASGIILEMFCNTGDEVAVLSNIAVIGQPGESTSESNTKETPLTPVAEDPTPEPAQLSDSKKNENHITATNGTDKIRISPRARNLAARLNIDMSKVKGSGPMGRILEKDVENAANALHGTTSSSEVRAHNPTPEKVAYPSEFVVKKISNVRRIIAEKMHESLKNSAQLTHHISAKATKILGYRKKLKSDSENSKTENITINDMVCYAVVKALKIKSDFNAHFLTDSIKTFSQVHLGIAVETDRGLMVPALKNAGDYSLPELSKALKSLADRCKNGNIDPELLAGDAATFTISNLGSFGVEMFTPVLNLPQTGILGVNTIIYRLEMADNKIESVPYIGLSLTYDHRAVDGAPASAFLKEVKNQIETLDVEA